MIKTVDLARTYRRGTSVIVAVNNVNLEVKEATFICITGPSGSGKTTLLNLIGLTDNPTSGHVLFNDMDACKMTPKERRKLRLRNLGFVFQTFNLIPTLTALENVELPMAFANLSQKAQRERATQLLDSVDLNHRLHHRPKELSAGEMQRVAIARALANDPSIIIADEPTGELDSETGREILALLSDLCRKQKKTLVVATHDEKVTEAADITYKMRDGSIISRHPP
jgi:putative ABC transport system ATP-binding protein